MESYPRLQSAFGAYAVCLISRRPHRFSITFKLLRMIFSSLTLETQLLWYNLPPVILELMFYNINEVIRTEPR